MATEDEELFYKPIKAGAKQAVKQGAAKSDLPNDLSKFWQANFRSLLIW